MTDRAAPRLLGAVRLETAKDYAGDEDNERPDITARTLGVDLHGDDLFIGNWWTPYTFRIHDDRPAPFLIVPEEVFYMSVGTVDVGASGTYAIDLKNDGTAPLTVYDIWVNNPAFVVTPPQALILPGKRPRPSSRSTRSTPSARAAPRPSR